MNETEIVIAPSIINCDFWNLSAQITPLTSAPWLHLDVMDNHFVPNISFGIATVENVIKHSPQKIDAHLMIENPDKLAPAYGEVGCQSVTFHLEAAKNVVQICKDLHHSNTRASLAIKPNTPVEACIEYLPYLDMVLIMTVEPGFGGQSFMADMMPKVEFLRKKINTENLQIAIQVDGGISTNTIAVAAEAGANVFVAGSAVFNANDANAYVQDLHSLAKSHFHYC